MEESGSDCTETGFGQMVRLPNMKIGDQPFPTQYNNQIMVKMIIASGVFSTVLLYHSVIQVDGLMRTAYPACLSSATTVSLFLLSFLSLTIVAQTKQKTNKQKTVMLIDIIESDIRQTHTHTHTHIYISA